MESGDTHEVRSPVSGRRSPGTHLLDAAIDVNVELLAEVEAHPVAETLRARGIRWVRQRDEGHPDGRAALAVGVADPVRSRVLRQGHQLVGTLPRDELCFQVLLPSSVQLHSHLTTSSGAAEELIRHAGGIARRPRCFPSFPPLLQLPSAATVRVVRLIDRPTYVVVVRLSRLVSCDSPRSCAPCARSFDVGARGRLHRPSRAGRCQGCCHARPVAATRGAPRLLE